MDKKYKSIRGVISPSTYVDLRIQGKSLAEIANLLDIPKSSLFSLVRKFKATDFGDYYPISPEDIRHDLSTDKDFSWIAYKHNVSPLGLRNYMTDYDIEDRLTEENFRAYAKTAATKTAISSYFGISTRTVTRLYNKYNLE